MNTLSKVAAELINQKVKFEYISGEIRAGGYAVWIGNDSTYRIRVRPYHQGEGVEMDLTEVITTITKKKSK